MRCNNVLISQEQQRKRERAHQHLEYHPKRTHTPEVIMVEQPLKLESTPAAKSKKKEQKEHLAKKHHHKSDSGADMGMCLEIIVE